MQLLDLNKRDIPGIFLAFICFGAVVVAPIVVTAYYGTVIGLLTTLFPGIVAIGVALRFFADYSIRLVAFLLAFCCMLVAAGLFNDAHSDQELVIGVTLITSVAVGFLVSVFAEKDDSTPFLSFWFVVPTFTSFFAIVIAISIFGSEKFTASFDESFLLITGGLLGLGVLIFLGGAIYYAIFNRKVQVENRDTAKSKEAHLGENIEDDGIKKLARLITGINNEVIKPLLIVIIVIVLVSIPKYIIEKIGLFIEYLTSIGRYLLYDLLSVF